MKILILTTEPLPYPGQVATGAGLRAWQLAEGLKCKGFQDVSVAMPLNFREQADNKDVIPVENCFNRHELNEFVRKKDPDILIVQHWGLLKELEYPHCPLVIDLAGPHLLERYYWGEKNLIETTEEKISALRKADFVVCGSHRQRYYFLPFLIKAGFEPTPDILPVIPFSVSPEIPEPTMERKLDSFVYGGMLLPWQDPTQAVSWLLNILDEKNRGELHFYGGPHPLGDISGGKFLALLDLLENHPRVKIHSLIPFDQLKTELTSLGVAVDVMARNFERELASTTRTIIYLWCGLPVIHHNYTELAEFIDYYEAGWVVDPNNEKEIKDCVTYILEHPEEVRRRSRNARQLIREHFSWDKTIEPLAEFCQQPFIRKNKEQIALKAETAHLQLRRLQRNYEKCQRELATLKGKKIFKLYSRFGSFAFIFAPFLFLGGCILSILMLFVFLLNDILSPFSRKGKR